MEFWRIEVVRKDKFSWHRLFRNKRNRRRNFLFWWRLASEMNRHGSKRQKEAASKISAKIKGKFACDVALEAEIGPCLHMPHHTGVVISNRARIGAHFTIRQNTTIGGVQGMTDSDYINIGDNVDIGANSCLIGPITVGNNAIIGAMSFVNKDIPENMIYITTKHSEMRPVPDGFQHMRTPEVIARRV